MLFRSGASPARLRGWRRVWRHTDLRPVAFLSACSDRASTIDGMIAPVPGNDWAALDAREWAYARLSAGGAVEHDRGPQTHISLYAVPPGPRRSTDPRHPILLSYLDVVVQGYLRVFGPDGVANFFATTDGWDAPILNDRAAPRYPRHQRLSAEETALVDSHLARLGATPA